jgi:plastocyanin
MFPPQYHGGAFIAFHGSWNRAPFPQGGYQVVLVPAQDGHPGPAWETFADGFAGSYLDPAAAAHRPAGFAQGPDGALYISDDKAGRVWRVVYRGAGAPHHPVGAAESAGGPVGAARDTSDTSDTSGRPMARPATGKTIEVKMIGDAKGYRFEPKDVAITAGDAIKWVLVSGPPHDVTFDPDSVPPAARSQLAANMPKQKAPLSSPYLTEVGETYLVSFAGLPAGKYIYYCTPHRMLGMVGSVTVR